MKKVLLASSALMMVAGAAMADVKISGSGRAGLVYNENPGSVFFDLNGNGVFDIGEPVTERKGTQVSYRLRFNVDASKETDSGVKFGGRIRFQDNTAGQASFSAAYVYAESGGFRVEVGNSNTAYDSAALMYNSEIGYLDRSFGDPQGTYFSFSSGGYRGTTPNRVGVFVSYTSGDLNVQASAVDADQTIESGFVTGDETEIGVSGSYKFGAVTVAAAAVMDGAGIDGNDQYYIAGEYAINDSANVGLQYFDNGDWNTTDVFGVTSTGDNGQQVTLYGNYKLANGVTIAGYIANNDALGKVPGGNDTAYGIGASYDLGGATLAGAIHQGYSGNTTADVGVKFSF
jgi:outer membrane protein OmpU